MTEQPATAPRAAEAAGSGFAWSHAVVVGIDDYGRGIDPLRTAVADACRLAALLSEEHGYDVRLVTDAEATRDALLRLVEVELPQTVGAEDRVLFYFAGHGVALEGDEGPTGYLVPQDARFGEAESYVPMTALNDALSALDCRHLLVILDSCFSGAFRWSSTRRILHAPPVIHRERYDRFIRDPAWQALASASHDQKALDVLPGTFGQRDEGGAGDHSPFAATLFEALSGAADVARDGRGDGVITATELYLYLEEYLHPTSDEIGYRQTPVLWPLKKHDKGEFIFHVPGREPDLPPAPPLDAASNPWRGLESYDEAHADLFFGRDEVIEELHARVRARALTVVLGASGTGKSSVVKAGLVPSLKRDEEHAWHVLPIVRPGPEPFEALAEAVATLYDGSEHDEEHAREHGRDGIVARIEARVAAWCAAHPNARLVLVVDQLEELVTLARSDAAREAVLTLFARLIEAHATQLRLVLTLRSDFEPQFKHGPLKSRWAEDETCYIVPALSQADLRAIIEQPASEKVMYFKPAALVDDLIDEVIQTPGGLPLLSFALSEMYVHYVNRYADGETDDRALEQEDYEAIGGVVGALRTRAEAEFAALDAAHRETLRRVMLRMVAPEGGNVARRRVPRSDLDYPDAEETERAHDVVRRLTAARLLVEGRGEHGEPYVEPAHDALVRAWDRLFRWIRAEEDRAPGLRFQQNLARAAHDWEQTSDTRAKNGLLWRDPIRGRLLDSVLTHEERRLGSGLLLMRSDRRSILRTAAVYAREGKWRAAAWRRRASDSTGDEYRPWMNRRELTFAQRSTERRLFLQGGLTLLVLLIIAGAAIALVQSRIAQANERESQARFLAAEMENALRDGDRPLAFRLAQEAWRTDDNVASRAALRRLSQTVLPLATVEGDKVLVPDGTPLVFTTRAIYDGEGRFVDSLRADHLAFAGSGAYFLAIHADSTQSTRDAVYVLHDGATAQPLARFDPAAPAGDVEVFEDETAGIVAVADDAGQPLARWPGALPLLSDDGRYLLSVRDVEYSPEFWMTWDLRDARGALLDTLAGYVPAPEREYPLYVGWGDGDAYGSFRFRDGRPVLIGDEERPLLGIEIYGTEYDSEGGGTEWAILNDWQNNLIADFVFDRTLGFRGQPQTVSVPAERRIYNEPEAGDFALDDRLFNQTQAHHGTQFFPATETLLLWDNVRGGELWSAAELRRARWLDGTYEKLSEDASHIVTREGTDLLVWSWEGHLMERHRGLDVFPTSDLGRHLLVRDDSLIAVRAAVGEGAARGFEDTFVFGSADGLLAYNGSEQFVRFDPEGRGFLTLAFDSMLWVYDVDDSPSLRRSSYLATERLRDWRGAVLDSLTYRGGGVEDEPVVGPRPGEGTTTRSCVPDQSVCAELVEKTIVVWDTLAAGPERPADADALRTYDLYERGAHIAFAPSGRFLLGVTAAGRAKLWAFDPTFDPAAFVGRYDETLRALTPDERARYGVGG